MVDPQAFRSVALALITKLMAAGWSNARSCKMVGLHRETYRRHIHGNPSSGVVIAHDERDYPNRVPPESRDAFIAVLNTPEYEDLSVVQAFMRMQDDGHYFFSLSTAQRTVKARGLNSDRRKQRAYGTGNSAKCKPVLAAFAPNEIWSWDITMFKGRGKITYKLYLIIDIFSRKIVGHRVETVESSHFAQEMIGKAAKAQSQYPRVLHADNGGPMRSATTAQFAATLGIKLSYSRPRVSDDNPYSEAIFKTVKYDLAFPERFDSLEHARGYMAAWIEDYNTRHRHSGLNYYTPTQAHDGTHVEAHRQRQATLDAYYHQHPERFRQPPIAPALPTHSGINYDETTQLPQAA
ncbi:IS3 family transposase [Arthrobacter psychrolactophilus]